jgi:hypothetical protein
VILKLEDNTMPNMTNFEEITEDKELRTILHKLYGSIDHLEAYTGGFAEDKEDGWAFSRLLGLNLMMVATHTVFDGDRFTFDAWEEPLPPWLEPRHPAWQELLRNKILPRYSTFGEVIRRNTAVRCIQNNPFKLADAGANPVRCAESTPYFDAWTQCMKGTKDAAFLETAETGGIETASMAAEARREGANTARRFPRSGSSMVLSSELSLDTTDLH